MIIRYLLLLFCILLIATARGFTQEGEISQEELDQINQNKKAFQKTFQEEQRKHGKTANKDTVFMDTSPATVPPSLLSFKQSNTLEAIGISNPCTDFDKAFQMAKYRALAMISVFRSCSVKYIADHYTNETSTNNYSVEKERWEEYGKITSSLSWRSDQVKFIDSHYTRYKEGMVKVKLNRRPSDSKDKLPNSLHLEADVYHVKNEVGNGWNDKWRYELKISVTENRSFSAAYTLDQTRLGKSVNSKWKKQRDSVCMAYYHYQSSKDGPVDTGAKLGKVNSLDKGLWAALLTSSLRTVLMHTHRAAKKIKAVDQSFNSNFNNLSRSIAKNEFSFTLRSLTLQDDKISTKFETTKR